ncbi:hypothetical protein [Algoriphagus namhaensis]
MKKNIWIGVALIVLISCNRPKGLSLAQLQADPEKPYRWIGDLVADSTVDSGSFETCHGEEHVAQYFHFSQGLQFEGEKPALERIFRENYQPVKSELSGWVRIRFVVNCQGKSGRFRVSSANEAYEETDFGEISDQLLAITRGLEGWKKLPEPNLARDYYQYLTFKIRAGQIEEILP